MELFLIRHGESVANKTKLIQGQLDTDLTKDGFKQAKLLGKRLKDQNFDFIYSSDLLRALNTAKQINKFHNNEIIIDKILREVSLGIETGKHISTLCKKTKEEANSNPDFKFKGGESRNDLLERIEIFYKQVILNPKNKNKKLAIICHGGVIKALLNLILENKNKISYVNEFTKYNTRNTCIYHIDLNDNKSPKLVLKNSIKHLE